MAPVEAVHPAPGYAAMPATVLQADVAVPVVSAGASALPKLYAVMAPIGQAALAAQAVKRNWR